MTPTKTPFLPQALIPRTCESLTHVPRCRLRKKAPSLNRFSCVLVAILGLYFKSHMAVEAFANNAASSIHSNQQQQQISLEIPTNSHNEKYHTNPKIRNRKMQEEREDQSQEESQPTTKTTPSSYSPAWVAHGTIAAIAWGLFVPSAIASAWFRELIPTYWIYIHVFLNVSTFALTFFAVGIAFATMKSMGEAGEGHLKELHHIIGLMLLLMVSFQTANGFLRPPREYITDDGRGHDDVDVEHERDDVSGSIQRSYGQKSMTARALWHIVHKSNGVFLFALGTWQVHSGLELFAKRFGTPDWSAVYLGYIIWIGFVFLVVKGYVKWKDHQFKRNNWYDPETDLAPVQFET